MEDAQKFYSSIKPEMKRNMLLRGSAIAGVGALIILLTGTLIPPHEMEYWGWPSLITSLGLITLGLLPYRRLCALEDNPNILVLTSDGIIYYHRQRKRLTLPFKSIEKIEYLQDQNLYGIGIWLKEDAAPPTIHDPLFNANSHQKRARKLFKTDLLLPFFTERVCNELI